MNRFPNEGVTDMLREKVPLDPLGRFGQFLMENLRDKAIQSYDGLAKGHWKAPSLQQIQRDLKTLDKSQLAITRRSLVTAMDHGIHDFLFALQELADYDIQVIVRGKNIAEISDGLHGELFGDEGWRAKFSAYGEPTEEA